MNPHTASGPRPTRKTAPRRSVRLAVGACIWVGAISIVSLGGPGLTFHHRTAAASTEAAATTC